jgi:hypothetical protein
MVTDYEALAAGVRRFVGRDFDPNVGNAGGWVEKSEPSEVPERAEYILALKAGDLLPANEETAKLAGSAFVQKAAKTKEKSA